MVELTYLEFKDCVQSAEPRFAQQWLNQEQDAAVSALPSSPVFIVAGPGTGKTTVLALRVLKHIFVDGFPPESIMATTFTRKAAKELSVKGFSEKLKACHAFADRVIHDSIDLNKYATCSPGHQILADIVQDYHTYLKNSQFLDFPPIFDLGTGFRSLGIRP